MIGAINSIRTNNQNQMTFQGAREGRHFRRKANKLITTLKNTGLGGFEYRCKPSKNQPSIQDRLSETVFIKAAAIGEEHVTPEDRRLHEKLKELYRRYEEAEDFADAFCGGGGRFESRKVNYTI